MTPDEHAREAERLLETSAGYAHPSPVKASYERRAIAHATLSLRLAPIEEQTAPRRAAKKTTTKKSTATKKEKDA